MFWASNALRDPCFGAAYSLCAHVGAKMTIQSTQATRRNVPVFLRTAIYLR